MKIAVITDDGKTISQHFGHAPYYLVVTVENNKIIDRELRDKPGTLNSGMKVTSIKRILLAGMVTDLLQRIVTPAWP
jgi:predicted Fe-Mo cluster-binding NifX family protein